MERRTVEIMVAGQRCKVVSTASDAQLRRLVARVEAMVADVKPNGRSPAQALALAAVALAAELEEERAKRESLERRARDLLRRVLVRIDSAIASGAGAGVDTDEARAEH
jgi:cell division protein ZapA (FtsZ GTPase activity inhibitor)